MKAKIIILAVFLIFSFAGNIFLFWQKSKKSQAFIQCGKLIEEMKQQVSRQEDERHKLEEEDKKLKQETVSFLEFSSELKEEKARLEEELEKLKKENGQGEQLWSEKESKYKQQIRELKTREEKLREEIAGINQRLAKEKDDFRAERALLYYNLAVAYTNAGFYELAEETFRKSLEYGPDNPDAYYNLGLLYEHFIRDNPQAVRQYLRYLELKPDAEDKDEVQGWIDGMN